MYLLTRCRYRIKILHFLLKTVAVAIFGDLCRVVSCVAVTHNVATQVLPFQDRVDKTPPIRIRAHNEMSKRILKKGKNFKSVQILFANLKHFLLAKNEITFSLHHLFIRFSTSTVFYKYFFFSSSYKNSKSKIYISTGLCA